uniref:Uncharacterized protein n=1 Tax=Paspalum vaginatum TaxID=158149 RepID=A0A140GYN8_9POAL|nr:hypothetical protein [Paspalum vaginatum]
MAPSSSDDCGWMLYLSMDAKCPNHPHRLLIFLGVFVAACVGTSLLHWACPGGPWWGWYWWVRRRGLRLLGCSIPGPRGLPWLLRLAIMTGLPQPQIPAAAAARGDNHARRTLVATALGESRLRATGDADVSSYVLAPLLSPTDCEYDYVRVGVHAIHRHNPVLRPLEIAPF